MSRRALIAAAVLATSRLAVADPVAVKVVEIAAGVAYVEPGRAAGIVPGAKVHLGTHDLVVVEATAQTAVVRLDDARVAVGDSGTVDVTPGQLAAGTGKLAAPHPPDAWTGQWPAPVMPAKIQAPKPVPLGAGEAPGHTHVTILGHAYGEVDKTGVGGQAEARVISSFDVMTDRPLSADVDLAARAYASGWNSGANTPVFLRAAQLRYGDAADPRFAIGRLRYAASSVGMLDGGRAAMHLGAFELAAFGGLVPDPVNGQPDTSASRFGVEAAYDLAKSAWQPRVALTVSGSTWNSAVDERRLALSGSATHGATFLTSWAELQSFAAGNPFGASAVEVTGAGASGEWRQDGLHLGVDVTFLRPERSLRLLAALPPDWLCTRIPQRGDVATEACRGGDSWTAVSGSAGLRRGPWSLDAVGSLGTTHGVTKSVDMSGYLRGELHMGHRWLELGTASGRSSFARWVSADVGFGTAPSRRYDLSLRYRPELLDYSAGTGAYLLHSLSLDLHYAASTALDLGVSALGTTGADRDAIVLLTTLAWRPLP